MPDRGPKSFEEWYQLLLIESWVSFTENDSVVSYCPSKILIATATAFVLLNKFMLGALSDVLLASAVLTLWSPVGDFEQLLQSTSHHDLTEVDEPPILPLPIQNKKIRNNFGTTVVTRFEELRKLSKLLSYAIGGTLISFIGEGMFTYAINFNHILFAGTTSQSLVVIYFYVDYVLILLTASDICRKVRLQTRFPLISAFIRLFGYINHFCPHTIFRCKE